MTTNTLGDLTAARLTEYLEGGPSRFEVRATLTVEPVGWERFGAAIFARTVNVDLVRAGILTLDEALLTAAAPLQVLAWKAWPSYRKAWAVTLVFLEGPAR